MKATYTKLKSGDWGLRVEGGDVKAGQSITVTKKDGDTKTETVAGVLWTGNGVQLCSIKPKQRRGDYPGKMCPVCGSEPLDEKLECWECGYKGE